MPTVNKLNLQKTYNYVFMIENRPVSEINLLNPQIIFKINSNITLVFFRLDFKSNTTLQVDKINYYVSGNG